jgi:hypothetical protein
LKIYDLNTFELKANFFQDQNIVDIIIINKHNYLITIAE